VEVHNAPTAVRPRLASKRARPDLAWLRVTGGLAILAVLVWRVGTGPFLHGLRAVDGPALVAACGIGVVTTVCAAWRWRQVAAGLGVRLPPRGAVAAYYRSQFLNTALPGGVLGDVHRAFRHGRDIDDVGLGVRAVILERTAGQVVQLALAVAVLATFPSPVRSSMPAVLAGLGLALAGLGLAGVGLAARRGAGLARLVRSVGAQVWAQVRAGLLADRAWVGIVVVSAVVVTGHLATFLVAARAAGSAVPLTRLVPLTLLALLAMGVPVNMAGWGPREGVAAWAFGAAGLTASQGVATAVTYGVLVFVASLPGAAVLLVESLRRPSGPVVDLTVEPEAGDG
jgi:glycosyltransferase 2 family protein